MKWIELFIYSLACWRLAVLVSDDTGPMKVFSRFRAFLKREEKTNKALRKSDVAAGIACKKCSSVWIAAPLACFAYWHDQLWPWLATTGDVFVLVMALSAASILIERALPSR